MVCDDRPVQRSLQLHFPALEGGHFRAADVTIDVFGAHFGTPKRGVHRQPGMNVSVTKIDIRWMFGRRGIMFICGVHG